MPYDFDKSADRKNTYSLKGDVKENELPPHDFSIVKATAPGDRDILNHSPTV